MDGSENGPWGGEGSIFVTYVRSTPSNVPSYAYNRNEINQSIMIINAQCKKSIWWLHDIPLLVLE